MAERAGLESLPGREARSGDDDPAAPGQTLRGALPGRLVRHAGRGATPVRDRLGTGRRGRRAQSLQSDAVGEKIPSSLMQSIAIFHCLPHGQSYADQVKTSHRQGGHRDDQPKSQSQRRNAEKARQQAMLKACGYTSLKRKHRTSLRPELPDLKVKQVAPTVRPHRRTGPGWTRSRPGWPRGCSSPMAT